MQALRGIRLQIRVGSLVALKGRSGSGKTTLLNCIGGLDRPTSGMVRVFGSEIAKMNDRQLTRWRRERVGFIFQSFGLLPTISAYENVELAAAHGGCGVQGAPRAHASVPGAGGAEQMAPPPALRNVGRPTAAGGHRRALANRPPLILADEPTGELDSSTAREILALFQRIVREEHVTMLLASHDPLVDSFVDDALQMKDGQLV